jgi:hypothetical protein
VEQGVSLQLWLPRLKKHAKSVPQVPLRWVSHNKNVKDVQQESSLIQWRVRRLTCARVARKDITLKTSAPNFVQHARKGVTLTISGASMQATVPDVQQVCIWMLVVIPQHANPALLVNIPMKKTPFRAKAVLLVGFLKKKGKKSHVMHAQQEHLE